MRLTFLGATKTVTGSKSLISVGEKRFLIDCGLFQGLKELRSRNWQPFPVDPKTIQAIILTHAHIDHSGYIPLLVKNGFQGKIYCSKATKELCSILLPDSGYLLEEEAKFANKHGYSKHKPALPLYTRADAENSLSHFEVIEFRKNKKLAEETFFSFIPSGHILGASFVQFNHYDTTLIFSGDLGRPEDPIMHTPAVIQKADYLILESTYGDRVHDDINPLDKLADVITRTFARNGTVVIPSFAVGRAQHILYLLHQLTITKRIPVLPIYVDSPMATNATEIFRNHADLHRLSPELSAQICAIATYVNTKEESKALDQPGVAKIIISASGMLEGGRVLHHLRFYAPDERNTILFTGYQALGTRGENILNGKKTLRIFGDIVPVAAEVDELSNMSAHADVDEIMQWLRHFNHVPRKVFLNHGELHAAEALKKRITDELGWTCVIPDYLQSEEL